jgi:hypothetical protein
MTYARGVLNMGFDEEGRRYLIEVLQRVQATQGFRHDHLMTEEWGGWQLSVGRVEEGEEIVHQVDLGLLPPSTDSTEDDRTGG